MNKKLQIDITNPEWTVNEINHALQYTDLPESLKKEITQLKRLQPLLDSVRAQVPADESPQDILSYRH